MRYFYPRPPRVGRLPGWDAWGDEIEISIHALREEGDPVPGCSSPGQKEFLSTPSARRATKDGKSRRHPHQDFYPRPPRGGRHKTLPRHRRRWQFLSTPSARRATWLFDGLSEPFHISIHALREEGDLTLVLSMTVSIIFLSTPSARRATCHADNRRLFDAISIHALREEGDSKNRDKSSIFKQIIQHSARI